MLRVEESLYRDCKALTLNHDMSMNLLMNEMIQFAIKNGTFNDYLQRHFKLDDRHGHYIHMRGIPR